MNTNKKKYILIGGFFIVICLIGYYYFQSRQEDWKEMTTPLPANSVETLCENFNIRSSQLCNGTHEVYGPDFYNIIRETFQPYEEYQVESNQAATYDEVEKKIGIFQYECDNVVYQADSFTYFTCFYDLRGDRVSTILIIFTYPENRVFRISTSYGDND